MGHIAASQRGDTLPDSVGTNKARSVDVQLDDQLGPDLQPNNGNGHHRARNDSGSLSSRKRGKLRHPSLGRGRRGATTRIPAEGGSDKRHGSRSARLQGPARFDQSTRAGSGNADRFKGERGEHADGN